MAKAALANSRTPPSLRNRPCRASSSSRGAQEEGGGRAGGRPQRLGRGAGGGGGAGGGALPGARRWRPRLAAPPIPQAFDGSFPPFVLLLHFSPPSSPISNHLRGRQRCGPINSSHL